MVPCVASDGSVSFAGSIDQAHQPNEFISIDQMEQATQPKAPQPRLPRGTEEKGIFDGLDAKLEEGEFHLLADLAGLDGDVSAIRLVCEEKKGSGSEEVGNTVRINGMNYEDHKVNGQEVAEEHRVQVENGQEKYVIPFKVTGLDNKPTYYFRTQLKTQDAWIEPKSDPKRRNTANTKKRKAAAAPAPAPALTPLVNEQVPQEDDDDVQMDDADPPAAAPTPLRRGSGTPALPGTCVPTLGLGCRSACRSRTLCTRSGSRGLGTC